MFFDLQKFATGDTGTTTENKWTVLREYDATHYTEKNHVTTDGTTDFWGFVPAGTSYTEGETITDNDTTSTQVYIFAKTDVKLIVNRADRINNRMEGNAILDGNHIQHGVEGNATAITLELHSGDSVSDLVVKGEYSLKTALKITIDNKVYNVYADGSVDTTAPYGLLSKADKRKLDQLNPAELVTDLQVGSMYARLDQALGGGEMTQNGFVLKNCAGIGVATINSVGLDAETAAATYATKDEMREYVRQVIASDTGYTFINGSGTTVAEIPIMQ